MIEPCQTTSEDVNQDIMVKVEEVSDTEVEDGREPVTFSEIKAEYESWTAVPKIEPSLYSEPCQTTSEDVNQDIMVKVEEVSDTEVEDGQEPVIFSEIKAEYESCTAVPMIEPGLCSEPYQTTSQDVNQDIMVKVEEFSATEVEEGREAVTFSQINAENESCTAVPKLEPISYSEPCETNFQDVNQDIMLKVEEASAKEFEGRELVTFSEIKAEHESCTAVPKIEPGLCSEPYQTTSQGVNQDIMVKVEEFSAVEVEEGLEAVTFSEIEAENESCTAVPKIEPILYIEPCQTNSEDVNQDIMVKVEEVSATEVEEGREPVTFSQINAENECSLNEREPTCEEPSCSYNKNTNLFTLQTTLKIHEQIYDDECTYRCDVYNKSFNTDIDLERQKFTHTGEHPFNCDVCHRSFNEEADLMRHQRIHSGERPYTCDVCHKSFREKRGLRKHQHIHSGERPYSCDVCHKSFREKCRLRKHQRIHIGELPYSCDVCHKSFREKGGLRKHQHIHSGERPYTCDVCHISFREKGSLRKHQRIHSGERPYSCDVCHKSFRQHGSLKIHQRIHSGERPYSCDVCHKSFREKDDMRKHQRIHSGERPYTCDVCHKSFIKKFSLSNHQRIHSGERPYSCDVCHKSFREKDGMRKHQRIHSVQHPYSCEVCYKSFSQEGSLKKHQHIHSEERPYSCDVCNKSFKKKWHLRRHQRTHSGERPYSSDVVS